MHKKRPHCHTLIHIMHRLTRTLEIMSQILNQMLLNKGLPYYEELQLKCQNGTSLHKACYPTHFTVLVRYAGKITKDILKVWKTSVHRWWTCLWACVYLCFTHTVSWQLALVSLILSSLHCPQLCSPSTHPFILTCSWYSIPMLSVLTRMAIMIPRLKYLLSTILFSFSLKLIQVRTTPFLYSTTPRRLPRPRLLLRSPPWENRWENLFQQ